LGDFTLLAAHLLHIHETNHSATDKFKSAVNANPTAAHKQHHHRLPHALNALGAMFISLLNSPTKQWHGGGGGDVGTAHFNSGASHSQSSRLHFAKQQPGKHVPTATKLTAFQHQQYAHPWK
jgi:hypothetical protein